MTKIGNYLVFLAIAVSAAVASAATTVQSSVDRNEMGLGDTFTLTISVSSNDDVDIQEPRSPDLDGFDMLNNWNSTAVAQKLIPANGGMKFETQRRKEFHYMLSPRRKGTLSVGAYEVVVDGKVYRTQPIVIKVGAQGSGGGARPRQQQQQQGLPRMPHGFDNFDDMDKIGRAHV